MASNSTDATPLTTTVNPLVASCRDYAEESAEFINYYTLASLIYLILLSFRVPRKQLWPKCCWRHPGIIFPVDFLMDPTRRLIYSAVFIVFAGRIVQIYNGQDLWLPDVYNDDPNFHSTYPYVRLLITYVYVIQLSVCFYSLMMCIQLRRSFAANVMGVLFTIPWIFSSALYYVDFMKCLEVRSDDDVANAILADIPVWAAFVVLLVSYVNDFVENVKHRIQVISEETRYEAMPLDYRKVTPKYMERIQTNITRNTIYGKYVRALLARKFEPNSPECRNGYMAERKRSGPVSKNMMDVITDTKEFRFPLRIFATVIVSLYVLSRIAVLGFLIVKGIHDDYVAGKFNRLICMGLEYVGDPNCTVWRNTVHKSVEVFFYGWAASSIISLLLQLLMVWRFTLRYRKHVRRLLRGDWSFMPKGFRRGEALPEDIMALNMRFSGYYVAFLSYGFVLLAMAIQLIISLLAYGLVLPLTDHYLSVVLARLKSAWPTMVITLIISQTQKQSARYVFLQSREVLGVDNKRCYHVFEYFTFFFNAVHGFYVANRRLMYSMFIGALRIGRLDKSFFLGGFQNLDEGHKTYLSVLIMELYHNHPIVRCMVENLIFDSLCRERDQYKANNGDNERGIDLSGKTSRAKLRWYKAYTLVRNPKLQEDYYTLKNPDKEILPPEEDKNKHAANGVVGDVAVIGGPELGVSWKSGEPGSIITYM